jgi:hypothetical protein
MGAAECLSNVNQFFSPRYFELNKRIVEVIDNFNLVQYVPLNILDEDSLDAIMTQVDLLVQYDDYRMPKEAMMPDNYEDPEADAQGDDY